MIAMEVLELFTALESNHPQEIEDVKHKFHEQFNNTREPWLLNGMYDYFMSTGSQRAVEVLVAVREPHDKFLFDRLKDGLQNANRLQALTLLGHVIKRQPTWLINITNHHLLKELIKILKSENETITIISAVLVLNILLTVIPARISSFLPNIFEGYSRLAAWNISQKNRVPEIHLFHLQISLYVLFVQLYSMYPCSFVLYLKQEYSIPENLLVFTHTVKPMLETVRMHPNLIVSSKDVETSTQRWKNMEQHDVVMECTKYTLLENGDRNYHNPSSWTSGGLSFSSSALEVLKSSIGATGDIISVNSIRDEELWSPMLRCGEFLKDTAKSMPTTPNIQTYYKPSIFNQNEHSPPEAAVEATPETTPIRDVIYQQSRLPSINSTVVRALNSFGLDNLSRRNSSSPNSQPSSPLKKEGFTFISEEIQSQALVSRMEKMILERNQSIDSSKDESSVRTESKPIAAQTQPTNNPEIVQIGDDDIIECDQQSNGSPCQTHEGGLHMPDSTSLKEFVISVRTRRRYHSQCTPEKSMNAIGQSTGNSPKRGPDFSLISVRRANSCPEIKKTNGSSISSGTSPLQEETEEDHGNGVTVSNGYNNKVLKNTTVQNNSPRMQIASTQTEHILPYEHLFFSIFPAYSDSQNTVKNQENVSINREDESLDLIEKYVRTSAIVLNHRRTADSTNDVKLLKDQISLLALQLQFERSRREVHAERNRRLLGNSRNGRAVDEQNSALKDQVLTLQVELENETLGFEKFRQNTLKQVKDLKESVLHWQTECLKYQEETKEAKVNCQSLEQLYSGERAKTAEITKQLSETRAELFNTLSELTIVQATADISKELTNTVTNLQRELVMCGEMQSRQRDVMTHVNAIRYDASNAMLSQESYRHHLNELQDTLYHKSALLEASNARITDLENKLITKNSCMQNEKHEMDLIKEKFNKQLVELKEECKMLRELNCQYKENEIEEESKKKFLEELPKFSSDAVMVDSNITISDQEAEHRLGMIMTDIDDSCDKVSATTTTPK